MTLFCGEFILSRALEDEAEHWTWGQAQHTAGPEAGVQTDQSEQQYIKQVLL